MPEQSLMHNWRKRKPEIWPKLAKEIASKEVLLKLRDLTWFDLDAITDWTQRNVSLKVKK